MILNILLSCNDVSLFDLIGKIKNLPLFVVQLVIIFFALWFIKYISSLGGKDK
jgi:hypothetical protein